MKPIRVGTRGSQLARTQTEQTVEALRTHHPGITFETVVIRTTGDARQNVPFAAVGTKGMFVKEIEEALLAGAVDFAVHSMKDMPGELPDGLALAAIPARADPRDALLSDGRRLAELPPGARVGTSSLRRQAQLRAARPDLVLEELRGNLDTRIRKLDEGQYDAVILACAGLERMGWEHRIVERLPPEVSVPAPGQGALALEARSGDTATSELLLVLHDADTADSVSAERGFQATLGAGCAVPAGAFALVEGGELRLIAMIAAPDGGEILRTEERGARAIAHEIGARAARRLLDQGGKRLLL
jgi:hydroxymethylbilane synthase